MRIFSVVLIALGAGISGYLLYRHLAPDTVWGVSLCPTVFGKNCEDTLRSSLSVQLGLPLAGWGLVYYGTLAALLLLGWAVGDAFRFPATLGALFLSWIGAVISVGLLCSMVTGAAPLCPLCALVHVINFFLIFPLKRFTGRTVGQL